MASTRRKTLILVLAVVAVVLGAPVYFYQLDIQQARQRTSTGSQIAETACGRIEYAVAGNGPPLLIAHGAGGGFDQGMHFSKRLVDNGFRVIAVSRFGYLRTPLPADASPAAQADAYACLLDVLGIQRVAIAAASAGAPSSLQFALRYPRRISKLVLLVPATHVPRPGGAPSIKVPRGSAFLMDMTLRSDFLFWFPLRFARATMVRSLLATPPALLENASPEEQERLRQILDRILPVSERRLGLTNDFAIISAMQRYDLERINTPTLTISFADDLLGTYDAARYTAEQIRGARFLGYPSGGHLWVGHNEEVFSEVTAFLKIRK